MKKTIIYAWGLLSAVALTSCNSLLEEDTDSFPSANVIYPVRAASTPLSSA